MRAAALIEILNSIAITLALYAVSIYVTAIAIQYAKVGGCFSSIAIAL